MHPHCQALAAPLEKLVFGQISKNINGFDGLILQCGSSEKTQPEFVSIVSKTPVTDNRNFAKNNNMKHMFHFLGSWAGRKIPNVHIYLH